MKERLLDFAGSRLMRLCLLVVFVVMAVSASAAVEWQTLTFDAKALASNKKTHYKFTPTEDGVLSIYTTGDAFQVCSKGDDENGCLTYETVNGETVNCVISKFKYKGATIDDTYYSKYCEASLKAGVTYYILNPGNLSGTNYYYASMKKMDKLTLESSNFTEGETFDVNDTRYGQLELSFNMNADADDWAYLKVGNYPSSDKKELGKIETHTSTNSGQLIFNLKDSINNWLDKGYIKAGDDMTLTITGIHATADKNIIYGEDGTLTLKYKAPGKAHNLVEAVMPSPFYSYWPKGDQSGIATLTFDYDVMEGDAQTANVSLLVGYADSPGGAYQEYLDKSKISASGKTLYIDFTDKLRTYEAMGLTQQYGTIRITVQNVLLADGTNPYSSGVGHAGSYTYSSVQFEEKNNNNVKPQFDPESGATLEDNLKVYFSDKSAYTFTGVRFTYQDYDDNKYQTDVTEGITSENQGKNGIEYTIPVPAAVKAGKNVRLSFLGLVSSDGLDHSDMTSDVKYNPGKELLADLAPKSSSLKSGAVLASFESLVLTFDDAVVINSPEGRKQVVFTDATTGKSIDYTIALDPEDSKKVVVTPTTTLKNTHSYSLTINEAVVVNDEYISSNGKYGRYMTQQDYTFSLNSNTGKLDFVVTPVEGSTLNEISTITCKTDPSRSSSTYALAYSGNKADWIYVSLLNEKGEDIAHANIKSCDDNDGFTLTFSPAITEPGTYTVHMTDSVYYLGEGYEAAPNEQPVEFSYTVVAAPKAEISFTADPADEATVKELSDIVITTDEPVYCDDNTPITVYNNNGRKTYTATMSQSLASNKELIISLDTPLSGEDLYGDYRVYVPAGVFGDQTWYESDRMTGRVNVDSILLYTLGEVKQNLFTTDPAAGNVTSLKTIIISVGDGTKNYNLGSGKVTITDPDGKEIFSGDPDAIWPDDWDAPVYQYTLTLKEEQTAEGTYTLTIPDGYFADESGDGIDGTTITWTIGNSESGDTEKSFYTTDPKAGEVNSLKTITISVGDGSGSYTCGSGKVIVTDPNGNEIFTGDPETIWPDNFDDPVYQFTIALSEEQTTAGTYTLTIPEGYFLDDNGDGAEGATITWTITATGINAVAADGAAVKIYSLDGKALKSVDGKSGIFIINGKKKAIK